MIYKFFIINYDKYCNITTFTAINNYLLVSKSEFNNSETIIFTNYKRNTIVSISSRVAFFQFRSGCNATSLKIPINKDWKVFDIHSRLPFHSSRTKYPVIFTLRLTYRRIDTHVHTTIAARALTNNNFLVFLPSLRNELSLSSSGSYLTPKTIQPSPTNCAPTRHRNVQWPIAWNLANVRTGQ